MIDFEFIKELEGSSLAGYVPEPTGSISGVTIASGFDIGQRNSAEIFSLFSDELAQKLSPYSGMIGEKAQHFLDLHPLAINQTEYSEINDQCHMQAELRLLALWKKSLATIAFSDLASNCQTVIASVAFQYGDLSKKTPRFWQQVTQQEWQAAIDNLRDFGDKYSTRRNKEADLLEQWFSREPKVSNE